MIGHEDSWSGVNHATAPDNPDNVPQLCNYDVDCAGSGQLRQVWTHWKGLLIMSPWVHEGRDDSSQHETLSKLFWINNRARIEMCEGICVGTEKERIVDLTWSVCTLVIEVTDTLLTLTGQWFRAEVDKHASIITPLTVALIVSVMFELPNLHSTYRSILTSPYLRIDPCQNWHF